jgi:hypothetical protein
MRTAALLIAGFILLAGASELRAQARDTISTRVQAFPKPAKVKATAATAATTAPARAPARTGDAAMKGIAPPKTKSAPPPKRADSLPVFSKPPKAPGPPA